MEAIVAMDNYGSIGVCGKLLMHDSEDLQHFKRITLGTQVFAGRLTAESLPSLKSRRVVTVSQSFDRGYSYEECLMLEEMSPRSVVIGGTQIYELFWDDIQIFHVTQFDIDLSTVADTFFPYQRLEEEFTLVNTSMSDGGGRVTKLYQEEEKVQVDRTYDTYVRT